MAAGGAEEHFAKKLANNEKIIRDKAVNKLRAWIRSRPKDCPGFSEVDLLKIWKGLFYCMWMSDKPLIQEELALNISQLVLSFRNEKSALLFIKTFFKTMQREWHGIDRLRLDKFYLLIRFFVKETFNFLKKAAWEEWLVSEVSNIYHEEPMNPTSQAVPDGIRLHMVSVFVTELESVVDDKVPASVLLKLLDPLILLAAYSKNVTVTGAVKKSLFEYLVHRGTDEADKTMKTVRSKVDFSAVADRLFTLASDRNVLGRNRNQLFSWSKRLRKQSTGQLEEGDLVQEGETSNGIPVGKKRKKAEKSSCLVNGSTEENCGEKDHTRKVKQKRKKRKHDGETEKEQEKQDKDCIKGKKEERRKRRNTEDVLNAGSCLGEEFTCKEDKVESKKKKKKKKKSLVDISNRAVNSEDSNSDYNNDCKKLTITNGSSKSEEHESSKSLVNGSSQSETSAVNGDTRLCPQMEDQTPFRTPNRKALHKAASSSREPFAKFQKNSTPPAFVRKCLAKTPSTEPQQSKTSKFKNQPPGSVPPTQSSKRVRIEMSKNTSHTTQDYQRSLKESPRIPFDAHKTPTQGLLKSPPLPRRTTLVLKATPLTDPGQGQQRKKQANAGQRPKAIDFF